MNDLKDLLHARLFLLDMDGTLYLGDDVFPGAVDFINTLADTGRQYIYLTNNSSRAGTDYITRLRRLGFPCEAENVFTSGMATALYLNQHYAGKPVYLVGTQAFRRELLSYGIPLVEEGAESSSPALTPSSCMRSSTRPCTSCAAARSLSPPTPTGSAPCRPARCCPTAGASARC